MLKRLANIQSYILIALFNEVVSKLESTYVWLVEGKPKLVIKGKFYLKPTKLEIYNMPPTILLNLYNNSLKQDTKRTRRQPKRGIWM